MAGRRTHRERGDGPVGYLAVLLLIAAIAAALALTGVGGQVAGDIGAAVCRVAEKGGLVAECRPAEPGRPPVTIPDPDAPTGPCLVNIDTEYLELTVSGRFRYIDILTDGGGQLTLRKYVRPDGTVQWQVWDMSWMDAGAGVSVPAKTKKRGIDAGLWVTGAGANTEIYHFDNEQEAREFYQRLRDYRIGNWAKLGVRTNPITGAIVGGLSKIPGIGDDIDDFFGGREPDRKPDQEVFDGGVMAGFYNDVSLGGLPLSVVGKNFGWASGGVWKNNTDGTTTYYFQGSEQIMESLELDVGQALKKLKLAQRTPANVQKAIDFIEKELTSKFGTPVKLPEPVRRAIATDTGLGVGLRGTVARYYGITYKDGKPIGFTQLDDVQGSWHVRGDVAAGPLSAWLQDSQGGTRWRTTKELDLTNAADAAALRAFLDQAARGNPVGGALGLDGYFANGGGKMSRVHYDYHVRTADPSLNVIVAGLAYENEWAQSAATEGEYFKPGLGWVKWPTCGQG